MQRRDFLLLPGLLPLAGCAETETAPATDTRKPDDSDPLLAIALARHGRSLSPDEIVKVRAQIEANRRTARRLAAFPLDNADEPVFAPSSRYDVEEQA